MQCLLSPADIIWFQFLRFDLDNFLAEPGPAGFEYKGSLLSPTRAIINIIVFSNIFVVPILYMAIFQFRNRFDTALAGNLFQHRKITQGEDYHIRGPRAGFSELVLLLLFHQTGISDSERTRRKESNILSTKINFLAWLFEVNLYLKDHISLISWWEASFFSSQPPWCLFHWGLQRGNVCQRLRRQYSTSSPLRKTHSSFVGFPHSSFALILLFIHSSSDVAA